ncbi:MAG: trypsin-like serine protease [Oligoflexales bacterium]|nr:trypsin-like serine protease [Oligoflexales bacterium]
MTYLKIAIYLVVFIETVACSSSKQSAHVKMAGGQVATANQFPSVVYFPECTATKISERVFLTAAHCVVDQYSLMLSSKVTPGHRLRIYYGVQLRSARHFDLTIQKVLIHPSYLEAINLAKQKDNPPAELKRSRAVDLSLIFIKEQTPEITVAELTPNFIGDDYQKTTVGYGCEMTLSSDRIIVSGRHEEVDLSRRLKYAEMSKTSHDETEIIFHEKRLDDPEVGLCFGDSGGGVFIYKKKHLIIGEMISQLVAVNSATTAGYKHHMVRLDDDGKYKNYSCIKAAMNSNYENNDNRNLKPMC